MTAVIRRLPKHYKALNQTHLLPWLSSGSNKHVAWFRTVSPLIPTVSTEISPTIAPVTSLFRDFDNYFFKSPFFSASDLMSFMREWDTIEEGNASRKKKFLPGYDVSITDDSVKILIDLPGVKMEDISIDLEDEKTLRVHGQRKTSKAGSKSELYFEKTFSLDKSLDTGKISAVLTNGVLEIALPKVPEKEREKAVRKIEVTGKTSGEEVEN